MIPALVDQCVLKDPTDSCRIWAQLCLDALRESLKDAGKVLEGPRARPIDICPFLEDDVDVRITEIREAPDILYFRRPQHAGDDRVRDLILHDVRAAIPPRIDDHLR